jgi:hypothetical protein
VIEGYYRQRFFRRCRSGPFPEFGFLFGGHPLARVVMRDDRRFWTEGGVGASVISVPVRVKNKFQLALAERF